MHALIRNVLVGLATLGGPIAAAQIADRDASSAANGALSSAVASAASVDHDVGSTKNSGIPVGPYITQFGVGAGGANVSELYTTFTYGSMGYNVYGYNMAASVNMRVADDFIVGQTMSVNDISWLTYQTGAATTGSITGCNFNVWNTNPKGQFPGSQWATGPANALMFNSWTGVYRVIDSNLMASNRAIIKARCQGAWIPVLASGTYWIDASSGGTLTSGPWAPVKTVAGQVPPTGDPWNGMQSTSGGAFAQLYDTGNPLGSIHEPVDFLFEIQRTACLGGPCGPNTFCTSKTSSLGCVPSLTRSSPTASKSGAPATTLMASPVPGGPGLPGIVIYATTPPVAPISTAFGFLCLSGFARAGAFASAPGGTSGTCTGAYTWNVAAMAASTPTILIGDVLRFQAWYRDPGFPPPGNANLTHGLDGITIVP
jgi:hypothetical protein